MSTSEKVIYRNGALAQLGARLNGIQKVTGSIPVFSTQPSVFLLIRCTDSGNSINGRPNIRDGLIFSVIL